MSLETYKTINDVTQKFHSLSSYRPGDLVYPFGVFVSEDHPVTGNICRVIHPPEKGYFRTAKKEKYVVEIAHEIIARSQQTDVFNIKCRSEYTMEDCALFLLGLGGLLLLKDRMHINIKNNNFTSVLMSIYAIPSAIMIAQSIVSDVFPDLHLLKKNLFVHVTRDSGMVSYIDG